MDRNKDCLLLPNQDDLCLGSGHSSIEQIPPQHDTFVLSGKSRSVIRGIGRDTLKPLQKEVSPMKTKTPKKRGVER